MTGWISVEDDIPKHDAIVLVETRGKKIPDIARFLRDDDAYYFMSPDLRGQIKKVTRWMELPK